MKRVIIMCTILLIILNSFSQENKFKFYLNYNKYYNYINYKLLMIDDYTPSITSIGINRKSKNSSISTRYNFNDTIGIIIGYSNIVKEYSINYSKTYNAPNGQLPHQRFVKIIYFNIPVLASFTVLNKKNVAIRHSLGVTTNIYNFNTNGYIVNNNDSTYYVNYNNKYAFKVFANITFMVDADIKIFKWGGVNIGGVVDYDFTNLLKEPDNSHLITLQLKAGIYFN